MPKSSYWETDPTDRWWARHPFAAFWLLVLVLAIVIPLGIWGFRTVTANPAGRAQAYRSKESGLNRTQAQAQFHSNFEAIKALDQKLTDAQTNLSAFNKEHPGLANSDGSGFNQLLEQQQQLQTDVTGAQQECRNAVADYNAATETYTLRDFRDHDLPYKISSDDPVFNGADPNVHYNYSDYDCQANAA